MSPGEHQCCLGTNCLLSPTLSHIIWLNDRGASIYIHNIYVDYHFDIIPSIIYLYSLHKACVMENTVTCFSLFLSPPFIYHSVSPKKGKPTSYAIICPCPICSGSFFCFVTLLPFWFHLFSVIYVFLKCNVETVGADYLIHIDFFKRSALHNVVLL